MKTRAFAIALLAALILLYQGQSCVVAFLWATGHAGPLGAIWLLPVLIFQVLLWGGYRALRGQRVGAIAIYALVLVLASEVLLPRTPLQQWRRHRMMSRVEVRQVRDQPYREIGVRVTFEAVFPERGRYHVSPTGLSAEGANVPYELHFGHGGLSTSSPAPQREGGHEVFDPGVVYTMTTDILPNFVDHSDSTKAPCIRFVPRSAFSEKDFLDALSRARPTQYRTTIDVSDPEGRERRSAATYVTVNSYDVHAIYRAIMNGGAGRCAPLRP